MTATKKIYTDIKTGKSYEDLPPGKVPVPNYESLSPKAQNQYVEYLSNKNPYELPEVVVQGNSQGLPIIDHTETDQNLKIRDYNRKADRWANSEYDSARQFSVYAPTQWLSPSHWIGYGKHLYNGEDWKEGLFHNSGVVTDEFYQEHPILSQIINTAGDAAVLGFPYVYKNLYPKFNQTINRAYQGYRLNKLINTEKIDFESLSPKFTINKEVTYLRKIDPKQAVKTSGIKHKTTKDKSRIVGSRNVTDPNNPKPINYHNPRITVEIFKKDPKVYNVQNYTQFYPFLRGKYMSNGIQFIDDILMDMGTGAKITKVWTNPDNIKITDYIKRSQPVIKTNRRFLPINDENWFWTDMEPITLLYRHRNGGQIKL